MPRIQRNDDAGSWHHVTNGGIGQRALFETESDFRHFLDQVAAAVRRGEIEVHGYCLLTNHFHLQMRSLRGDGGMSAALGRIQGAYARRFNAKRKRKGPLFSPRFWSQRVDTQRYRLKLARYLDSNVVDAGLAERAVDYEYCSAYGVARECPPPWLATWWVDALLSESACDAACSIERYLSVFPAAPASPGTAGWIRRRSARARADQPDELLDLDGATPAEIDRWLRRKAIAADGPQRAKPAVPPGDVLDRFRESPPLPSVPPPLGSESAEGSQGTEGSGRSSGSTATPRLVANLVGSIEAAIDNRAMLVGSLRVLARLTQREIGTLLGLTRGEVRSALARHRYNIERSQEYGAAFSRIVHEIVGGDA